MNIDPNDPRLTAFVLGELDPTERAMVEALIIESADCRAGRRRDPLAAAVALRATSRGEQAASAGDRAQSPAGRPRHCSRIGPAPLIDPGGD